MAFPVGYFIVWHIVMPYLHITLNNETYITTNLWLSEVNTNAVFPSHNRKAETRDCVTQTSKPAQKHDFFMLSSSRRAQKINSDDVAYAHWSVVVQAMKVQL